jgi:hypothetical protein
VRRCWLLALAALLLCVRQSSAQDIPHVDLQEGTLWARYRNVHSSAGATTADQIEDRLTFRARILADAHGRLALNVGAFTGSTITGGWNNTGIGRGHRALAFHVKQLYVAATPVRAVEVQAGSLYAARGESTEITSYDNDFYLTGERLTLRAPRQLLVDALTVTNAYIGDLATANAFERLHRLGDANYQQVVVEKRVAQAVFASGEWSRAPEGHTWRGAVRVAPAGRKTAVRLEGYRRGSAGGLAVSVDVPIAPRVTGTAGFAAIDRDFPLLSGDRFGRGRRLFALATVQLTRALSASAFCTHTVGTDYLVAVGQRWEGIVTWNVLAAARDAWRQHQAVRRAG